MSLVTIRQLRQHWPEVERQLAAEGELIVTRDDRPVAMLSTLPPAKPGRRKRFSAQMHDQWMKEIWGAKPPRLNSAKWLDAERKERFT